ncbi:NAD(P)/FAD-dependent oxidoreductase [Listeria ivanovii]|uniref:NAD(P)/FAD-dependent oxidoreductase n=1 Tax=Listeria ivanovii TaxID=1638 RepID=UPI001907AB33|nr:NAD(P)/FAD-dependent oxidoreductase [Listeria ivanovii]MBK2001722.1 NAD(P)/FAD-dependent oxidoreductase [Listeria ivanovii subsp. londoniensis]MBM5720355.1 NAD(P)/FAD-dependent oxidoreductase [Listeria ivanovii]
MDFDVIVIGGGPSGLMAAISAAEKNKRVLLIEKGPKLGRKLIMSGGGRCNVTNRRPADEIIKHIPGNGRFLYSAFHAFDNEDIIRFFERLGVELKEEDHGRMFPVSNSARSVAEAMINRMEKLGVKIYMQTAVKQVNYADGKVVGVTLKDGQEITTQAVVVAVGGKSVPRTGSTGDGYAWAKKAGHTITELYPTEVPITSSEPFIKQKVLQGTSLRNVELAVLNAKGKPIITHQMDMIFTHFGVSGPAALRCSMFVLRELKKAGADSVKMRLNLFPDISVSELSKDVYQLLEENPKKALKNALAPLLQEKILVFLLAKTELDESAEYKQVSPKKMEQFIRLLQDFTFEVNGTLDFEKAFVTGGGVSVKEIKPKEMESKLIDGLFFCGEILDINGYTGGYNITCALVTGHTAGAYAAKVLS